MARNATIVLLSRFQVPIEPEAYIDLTRDCEQFRHNQRYILRPLSREEEEFPIAYSMLVFKVRCPE